MILPGEGATHDARGEKTVNRGENEYMASQSLGKKRLSTLWSTVSKSPKMSFETEK